MIDRHSEITSFLKYTYNYLNNIPDDERISKIMELLLSYGLYKDEVNKDYNESYFSYFIEYYRNNKNLNVAKNSKDNESIIATNIFDENTDNRIKLSINVSYDDFFTFTSKLLLFLSLNSDIKHVTHISKKCTSNQIVIDLINKDDVTKINNFINGDLKLINSLRYPNPFMLRDRMIGFTFDKNLDFNSAISYLISEYLFTKHSEDEIKADDFNYFVKKSYNDLISYESFDLYSKFISDQLFLSKLNNSASNENITNVSDLLSGYLYIFEQFYRLYDVDDDLQLFNQLYDFSIDENENKNRCEYLKKKYDLYGTKQLLDSYIAYMLSVYKDSDDIASRIIEFAKYKVEGNPKSLLLITRENDFRNKFKNISADQIYLVTNNDINAYVDLIVRNSIVNDYDVR